MEMYFTFIIYVLIFRLFIIAAGIICIILGYRLFTTKIKPGASKRSANQRTKVKVLGVTLDAATPGIVFAGFGIILIVIILYITAMRLLVT